VENEFPISSKRHYLPRFTRHTPRMKHILTTSLTALALLSAATFAQEKPAAPAPPAAPEFKPLVEKLDLKDGDSIVFLGDSITHQCLYTQYVEDYFYTRYPKMHLSFHNAGVGGDRAADALTRFDEDVVPYKPKYVTILLGMNDGSYKDFDKGVFDTYQAGMTTILDKIAGLGATAIPMTPTMFDARAKRIKLSLDEPRNTYYNGVLALYGTWLREVAEVRGLGFVDMYSPLNAITAQQRKKKADWTMIQDGVHPGPVGQTVMAVAIIDNIVARSQVSQITVAEKAGKLAATAANGAVTEFQQNGDTVSFTFAANALPWVLPPDAAEGPSLTALGHRYGNEKITVRDLKPGKYELKIDGAVVGQYDGGALAKGVELQANDKTPQYQQALKVALLNKQRNDLAYHPLRDQYAQLKGKRRDLAKIAPGDPQLDAKKTEFDAWYVGQKARVAELLAQAKDFEKQIYAANQPQPRKYEFALVK
jgi:lysophospholipase L1-like esterase